MEGDEPSNILRNVVNQDVGNAEDEDFALAKMMQEQERAFYHVRNLWYGDSENEGVHSRSENLLRGSLPRAPSQEAHSEGDSQESSSSGSEESGLEQARGEDVPSEPLDDEELARRLHLAEQLDHHQRIMELAGIAPGGELYSDEEDEGYVTDDSVDPDEMTYEELRALGDAVGIVSRGASVDTIKALPFGRYAGPGKVEGIAKPGCTQAYLQSCCQEEQCVVCRMEFEGGEDIKLLPCKHVFHPDCIDQWLTINKACPICASEVTAASPEDSAAPSCTMIKPAKPQ